MAGYYVYKALGGGKARSELMKAAEQGDIQRVRSELHTGNVVNDWSESDGRTALMQAARYGRPGTCTVLIQAGADPTMRDKEGKTALMLARAHGHNGHDLRDILVRSRWFRHMHSSGETIGGITQTVDA